MATVPERLKDLIDTHKSETADELSKTILDKFIVLDKAPLTRGEQPAPAVDQLWRNRESHRLVRITELSRRGHRSMGDVLWEVADESRGPKTGRVFEHNWISRFTHVADA